jgi:hypothetical protein
LTSDGGLVGLVAAEEVAAAEEAEEHDQDKDADTYRTAAEQAKKEEGADASSSASKFAAAGASATIFYVPAFTAILPFHVCDPLLVEMQGRLGGD